MGVQYTLTRWRRYGQDRLYVTRADGTRVGWWDLLTVEPHPDGDHSHDELADAWRFWHGEEPVAQLQTPKQPSLAEHERTAESAAGQLPWMDLSTNSAGALAREQAVAAKQAAPVRSRLARVLRVHTEERAWRLGADGEERVAEQLAKVAKRDPRWHFLHAVPVGSRGSDIDHLAIGPGGVFTINAKNHPNAKLWIGADTFLVNGARQPYVRNARHEAQRAARLLSAASGLEVPAVQGLVVPVNAIEVKIKSQPKDVHVVPRRQVAKWLLGHENVLDEHSVATLFDAARRSTTWV